MADPSVHFTSQFVQEALYAVKSESLNISELASINNRISLIVNNKIPKIESKLNEFKAFFQEYHTRITAMSKMLNLEDQNLSLDLFNFKESIQRVQQAYKEFSKVHLSSPEILIDIGVQISAHDGIVLSPHEITSHTSITTSESTKAATPLISEKETPISLDAAIRVSAAERDDKLKLITQLDGNNQYESMILKFEKDDIQLSDD